MRERQVRLSVVKGGRYGQLRESVPSDDFDLDREMVDAFVSMHTPEGTVPSQAISDVRRFRQRPWRYLARRIREARARSVPIDEVRQLVRVLDLYIDRIYGVAPRRAA